MWSATGLSISLTIPGYILGNEEKGPCTMTISALFRRPLPRGSRPAARRLRASAALALVLGLWPAAASAATLEVGPGKMYATIQDTLGVIGPGDVVEVQGDQTYAGDLWFRPEISGTAEAPVTVRGVKVNGHRPILQGVGTQQYHDMVVLLYANHFVFEGFEIVGDGDPTHSGVIHKASDVTVRDVVVHGVGGQGLLGTDSESGSLTLDHCEFYGNGNGLYDHQIYMATDETMYPGSVFRMQYCYVHDGTGGNNVKSRAERNEIYYNWIEGALYHELDLIGPDGQDPSLAREDSDVVGNVLIKHSEWRIARIGGDGTGNTAGRYRFVNNTMILGETSEVAIGLQQTVETLEMHNNVILRVGGQPAKLWNLNEQEGPDPILSGSHNWIQAGFTQIPATFSATVSGSDPGFTSLAQFDLRPLAGSPLLDQGTTATSTATPAFPGPLALPTSVPPARALGTEAPRPTSGAPDIGAFELDSGMGPSGGSGGQAGSQGNAGNPGNQGGAGGSSPTGGQAGSPNSGGQTGTTGGAAGGQGSTTGGAAGSSNQGGSSAAGKASGGSAGKAGGAGKSSGGASGQAGTPGGNAGQPGAASDTASDTGDSGGCSLHTGHAPPTPGAVVALLASLLARACRRSGRGRWMQRLTILV
jgi:hypothetical protein